MSYSEPKKTFKAIPLTKIQTFENKLTCSFEIYFNFGSTFFLYPTITHNDCELFVFDWLWVHIGILKRGVFNIKGELAEL